MTDEAKPKGRHGGARPGAGRKPKVRIAATQLDEGTVRLLLADAEPDFVETMAQRHARIAMIALVKQLLQGTSEAARVVAANAILDRGYNRPSVEAGGEQFLPFASAPAVALDAVGNEMRTEARKYSGLAIETLSRIAQFGSSETAIVAASKSILDRGLGTVATAKMPEEFRPGRPLGKKETARRAAVESGSGKYATPAPPLARREAGDDESEE